MLIWGVLKARNCLDLYVFVMTHVVSPYLSMGSVKKLYFNTEYIVINKAAAL